MQESTVNDRWSDRNLTNFHREFMEHMHVEEELHKKQQDMYEAIFQLENHDTNTPAGVLQMMSRLHHQMEAMQLWQDRQKTFLGGVIFTVSAAWVLFSEIGPRLLSALRRIL